MRHCRNSTASVSRQGGRDRSRAIEQLNFISALPAAVDADLLHTHGLSGHPIWGYSVNSVYDLAVTMADSGKRGSTAGSSQIPCRHHRLLRSGVLQRKNENCDRLQETHDDRSGFAGDSVD